MSRTIRKYHNEAAAKRVKIVHMCGFDSIPSDLGSLMVATAMFNKHKRCASSRSFGYADADEHTAFACCHMRQCRPVTHLESPAACITRM